jgi:hypothetical protein
MSSREWVIVDGKFRDCGNGNGAGKGGRLDPGGPEQHNK